MCDTTSLGAAAATRLEPPASLVAFTTYSFLSLISEHGPCADVFQKKARVLMCFQKKARVLHGVGLGMLTNA